MNAGGSWALLTPGTSPLLACFKKLSGLMSTVIIRVLSTHEPPSRAQVGAP